MDAMVILPIALLLCLLVYAIYVAIRVVRYHRYTPGQKLAQCAIALFVPLFGAIIVHIFLRTDAATSSKNNEDFDPDYIGSGS